MQLQSGGAVIPLLAVGTDQSAGGGQGKFGFYCSNSRRLAHYSFIFLVKFSAVSGFELIFQ